MPPKPEVHNRFWSKVNKQDLDDCWNWTAACYKNGYGKFGIGNKVLLAHRVAFELSIGPIASNLFVCHKCDNKLCCNPNHLFLGTCLDNTLDKCNKNRQCTGSNIGNSKLTEAQVIEILADKSTHQSIAYKYGVSASTITLIKQGKIWKYVKRSK